MSEKSDASTGRSYCVNFKMSKKKAKRKKTSDVWTFFEPLPMGPNDDKPWAKCEYCDATFLKTCTRRDTHDVGPLHLSQNNGSLSVCASKFDAEKFRELLIAAVIKHDLPFPLVECAGLREILQYLRSDVPLISRNIVEADLVKMHQREKQRVKFMLNASLGRICLTSNLWTSMMTNRYMCIAAHFLDNNWVLQKRVLNFSFMPPPHNDISLCEKIYSLLCEWGIEYNVFSITSDNASSLDVSVDLLRTRLNIKKALPCDGEFFHLHCYTYILNLIVQDGLKEIDCAIQKVRDSIKYVKGSQESKQRFLDSMNEMSLDSKKGLTQDVPTRWNSTFSMLESALYYRRAFCHLEFIDSNFKHCPTAFEWDKVEKIITLLACFYDATCCFSNTKYHTSNLYFPAVFLIYVTLKQQNASEDEYKRSIANQMLSKFEKYWSEFNVALAIAVILDPRYKLQFIEYCFKKLYGVDGSIKYLHVRAKLFSIFMEYKDTSTISSDIVVEKHVDSQKYPDWMEEFATFEMNDLGPQKSQLEVYLDEPKLKSNMDLDILAFWEASKFRYPEVACMARDILSIPVSTVASESTFNVGGRVIDQFRSSLKPNILEALVCTKDWLYGEEEHTQMKLDELPEDIIAMDIHSNSKDIPISLGAKANSVNILEHD